MRGKACLGSSQPLPAPEPVPETAKARNCAGQCLAGRIIGSSRTGWKKLDPAALPLYGDILVRINLKRSYNSEADVILTCPLPAGVQAADLESDPLATFAEQEWYGARSIPQMEENRDDRHIAAFRLNQGVDNIEHAYLIKAVRAGQWHAPGCQVEDMYQPQQFARDKAQTFTIR